MGISQYLVIIFSVAVFLIPISQAEAVFFLTSEISDEQFSKNLKEIYNLKMQKLRDFYIEEYLRLQNPYNEKISENVISLDNTKFDMPKSIDRYDENFQLLKDKETDLAQKKYLEIMGGKSIISSLEDKTDKRVIPVLEFTDEEMSYLTAIHREDEDFQNYKMQQKIIAEETWNRMMEEGFWGKFSYVEDVSFENFSKNRDQLKAEYFESESFNAKELIGHDIVSLNRASQEFQDVVKAEVLLAEIIRNDVLKKSIHGNPYEENEDVIEINQKSISESSTKRVNRANEEFLLNVERQNEIALQIMNEMYNFKNFEENEIEINRQNEEVKKQSYYDRNDQGFKFFKQLEEERAKKKINEILGWKIISNYVEVKHKVNRNSLMVEQDFTSKNDEDFQNYGSIILAIADKIREGDYEEENLIPSSYISEEKIKVINKPKRDPNVLCFGLGC